MRARALSTLGGTFRIGLFIGPFAARRSCDLGIAAAYGFAAIMTLAAAILTAFLPDVTKERRTTGHPAGHRHRRSVGAGRAPSGAAHPRRRRTGHLRRPVDPAVDRPAVGRVAGIDAATTSLIFGISAGVDMLLFYPGGAIMDLRPGLRRRTAMSCSGSASRSCRSPMDRLTVGLVAALMGLGNGISAGVVMTLGADASPGGARPVPRRLAAVQPTRATPAAPGDQCGQRRRALAVAA